MKYVCFRPIFTFLLYYQVDPLEKLDPEVADILGDIAEDFLDSVSFFFSFYCAWADEIAHNLLNFSIILF
jgi:transcription initiation factor TFIID subunit TAF12